MVPDDSGSYETSASSSAVEYMVSSDWFLKAFSFDQMGQPSFKATANNSMSSGSGEMLLAPDRNVLYSERGITFTKINRSPRASSNSRADTLISYR
jgi:hypothetical protein